MHSQRNRKNFLGKIEGKDFCICGKMTGTLGELRDFVCLSSKLLTVSAGPG